MVSQNLYLREIWQAYYRTTLYTHNFIHLYSIIFSLLLFYLLLSFMTKRKNVGLHNSGYRFIEGPRQGGAICCFCDVVFVTFAYLE